MWWSLHLSRVIISGSPSSLDMLTNSLNKKALKIFLKFFINIKLGWRTSSGESPISKQNILVKIDCNHVLRGQTWVSLGPKGKPNHLNTFHAMQSRLGELGTLRILQVKEE